VPSIMSNFNLIDYVFNHFSGVSRTVFASDVLPLPNVYCGLLTLVLIISLFFNRKVNTKFKLMAILAIIFFLASFSINQIDFMWHAFHVPNDLPYRYSFLYVFTLITIASYSYVNLKKANRFGVYTSFIIVTLFIFLAYKFKFANLDSLECLTCLIFVIFYFITYLFSNFKFIPRRVIECFLIIFIMSEVTWGIKNNWSINHDIKNFMSTKDPFNKLICTVKEKDNSFYRIENTNYLTLNDGAWYDYPGISAFSSMAYESMAKTQRMLGLSGNNINSYYYKYYQTPVYNTMFSVKYLLGSYLVNPYYAFVDKEKSTNLVNYKYSLSPIYMVNSNLKAWSLSSYMPFYNQSNFVLLSTGVNNIYKDVSVIETKNASFTSKEYFSKTNGEYEYRFDENNNGNYIDLTLYNEKRGNVYLYVGGSEVKSFEVNGVRYDITSDEYFTLDTGLLEEGSFLVRINTGSNSNAKLKFYAYSIDDLAFNRFYDYLSKGQMNIKKYRDNMFEGSITANKNQLAFTSITYDDGWKVFIDKQLVNTYKIADSFLAFDVPPGNHEVKIIYYPKGMKTGLIISLFSMLLIIIIWSKKLVKQRNKQICKKKDEFNV
ncbi:MAG: YfhO family protein, partial [Bacilli bacterium]